MNPRLVLILIGIAGPGSAMFAQGGAPMLTNDTGTADAKQWVLTVAYTDQRAYSGIQQEQFPQVEIDYGLTSRVQLQYAITWLVDHEAGQPNRSALGNSQLGLKWRFYDDSASGFSASVSPQAQFHALSSSLARDQLAGGTTLVLPVEIQGRLGDFTWGAELGRNFVLKDRDVWFYGVVLGRPINSRLELDVELYATAEGAISHDLLTANVGARWQMTPHQTVLIAAGRGASPGRDGDLAFTGYLGLEWTF